MPRNLNLQVCSDTDSGGININNLLTHKVLYDQIQISGTVTVECIILISDIPEKLNEIDLTKAKVTLFKSYLRPPQIHATFEDYEGKLSCLDALKTLLHQPNLSIPPLKI